jgi:dTDP-4-dehydrorhamnose reductase
VNRPTVLVTGASGQLAHFVVRAFSDWNVVALGRASLDVADPDMVRRVVADVAPRVIVNCAAFNDVDGAERQPREALAVNAFAVRSLARAAEKGSARLVHYSTDFVFDGRASEPYGEDAAPAPQSTYAASKLLGEWFALEAPGGLVLRVESLFGSPEGWTGRRGTLDAIVDGLRRGREVRALTDRVVSPGYTPDIAAATRHLIDVDAPAGLYHCVNRGHTTWEAAAREAARLLGVEPHITPITVDQLTLAAARPRYCAMATTKLAATGFAMPAWDDALRRWLSPRRSQPFGDAESAPTGNGPTETR